MYLYTKNDYSILKTLDKKQASSAIRSMAVKSIQEVTGLSIIKIKSTMKLFLDDGFVLEGVPKGRAKTYYITKKGLDELTNVWKGEVEYDK